MVTMTRRLRNFTLKLASRNLIWVIPAWFGGLECSEDREIICCVFLVFFFLMEFFKSAALIRANRCRAVGGEYLQFQTDGFVSARSPR